jgi:hypothetical protein
VALGQHCEPWLLLSSRRDGAEKSYFVLTRRGAMLRNSAR